MDCPARSFLRLSANTDLLEGDLNVSGTKEGATGDRSSMKHDWGPAHGTLTHLQAAKIHQKNIGRFLMLNSLRFHL